MESAAASTSGPPDSSSEEKLVARLTSMWCTIVATLESLASKPTPSKDYSDVVQTFKSFETYLPLTGTFAILISEIKIILLRTGSTSVEALNDVAIGVTAQILQQSVRRSPPGPDPQRWRSSFLLLTSESTVAWTESQLLGTPWAPTLGLVGRRQLCAFILARLVEGSLFSAQFSLGYYFTPKPEESTYMTRLDKFKALSVETSSTSRSTPAKKRGGTLSCSYCHEQGHTRRTCKDLAAAPQPNPNPKTPAKKKKRVVVLDEDSDFEEVDAKEPEMIDLTAEPEPRLPTSAPPPKMKQALVHFDD